MASVLGLPRRQVTGNDGLLAARWAQKLAHERGNLVDLPVGSRMDPVQEAPERCCELAGASSGACSGMAAPVHEVFAFGAPGVADSACSSADPMGTPRPVHASQPGPAW